MRLPGIVICNVVKPLAERLRPQSDRSRPLTPATVAHPSRRRAFVVTLAALSALSCRPEQLRPALPPDVRVDTYEQKSASLIDVLWVVDNSGSMASRQQNLASNFQSFIALFSKGSIDFRIAVTTTDIFKDRGQLRGNPKVLTPTTPSLPTAFAANIKVGTNGSPYEAGLAAAQLALDAQNAKNQTVFSARESCKSACGKSADPTKCSTDCDAKNPVDFLRPDAYLYIIFVTDEEDESSQDVRYFWRSFETTKGIGNDGTVTTAAIIGEDKNTCGATPGSRYQALSDLTGGEVGSICDTNFSATLKKLATNAIGLKRKFALGQKPNPETIKVFVNYPCNTPDSELSLCQSVDKAFCSEQDPSSYDLKCTPPQGGPDGWSWDEKNNLIVFSGDSVPTFKAMVEIQYYPEGKSP